MMDVLEAIKTRRSIRKYKPDPVDEEKLRTVLEAARWAPSWVNTQCWEFIVVKDPGTKEKLAETLLPGNPATEAIKVAPLVIAACARLGISGFSSNSYAPAGFKSGVSLTDKGDLFMFDTALALHNLSLAAHAQGLGTVHVGAFDAKKAAEILGVPIGVCVVELMPLGYPLKIPKAPPRKELKDLVSFEKYGQK